MNSIGQVLAALLALSLCSCAGTRLRHGYRLVHRTVDMRNVPGAFEAEAHYQDLYCGSKKLGEAGEYSISPSGWFALFTDRGRLLLFDKESSQTRDVTDGSFAIPSGFAWDEAGDTVDVAYYEKHAPSKIRLRK